MKVLKGISLFFFLPLTMFMAGFWGGVRTEHFFYPSGTGYPEILEDTDEETVTQTDSEDVLDSDATSVAPAEIPVSARAETLSADTEYVVIEADIVQETEAETVLRLPSQYIGMTREQFAAYVENYSAYPPLSEQERGFVNAEVLSFARGRVVVRMNYRFIQQTAPDGGFYLAALDNEVVVFLEDKKTVYINTGILLESLPEEMQLQVIEMLYMEDEAKLYGFLETYSS